MCLYWAVAIRQHRFWLNSVRFFSLVHSARFKVDNKLHFFFGCFTSACRKYANKGDLFICNLVENVSKFNLIVSLLHFRSMIGNAITYKRISIVNVLLSVNLANKRRSKWQTKASKSSYKNAFSFFALQLYVVVIIESKSPSSEMIYGGKTFSSSSSRRWLIAISAQLSDIQIVITIRNSQLRKTLFINHRIQKVIKISDNKWTNGYKWTIQH